mgnify:CR=1 FL=1
MKVNQITDVRSLKIAAWHCARKTRRFLPEIFGERKWKEQRVQFSKHASQRVQERGIVLNNNMLDSLNTAVEKARQKGAKDVVVIGEKGDVYRKCSE